MNNTIFSCGHSNRGFSEFLQRLKENNIDTVIDIRSIPRSRFCPQYNRVALSQELEKEDIMYIFKGKNLGGRGENVRYEETIDELVEMIKSGKSICVMCSEASYKDCHRYSMLEPSFKQRGIKTIHIEYKKNP